MPKNAPNLDLIFLGITKFIDMNLILKSMFKKIYVISQNYEQINNIVLNNLIKYFKFFLQNI